MKSALKLLISIYIAALCAVTASAWQLSPDPTVIEKALVDREQAWYEKIFTKLAFIGVEVVGGSVHEEIVNRSLGCEGDAFYCGLPSYDPKNAYFIAGVRWNDDPPFRFFGNRGRFDGCAAGQTVRLVTQPVCWGNTFKDGEKRAAAGVKLDGNNATLLVRSHFGDLQFLHAMAVSDGEPATVTRQKILAWAEFTWRVARQDAGFDGEQKIWQLPIEGFSSLFQYNKEWRVQDLFALGNELVRQPDAMSQLALGSLLHSTQDSFARGHVERRTSSPGKKCAANSSWVAPGEIMEFHSYVKQDPAKHGKADSRDAFSAHWAGDRSNVVSVGQTLHALYLEKAPWETASKYLECVFTLDPDARPSSSGDAFSLK